MSWKPDTVNPLAEFVLTLAGPFPLEGLTEVTIDTLTLNTVGSCVGSTTYVSGFVAVLSMVRVKSLSTDEPVALPKAGGNPSSILMYALNVWAALSAESLLMYTKLVPPPGTILTPVVGNPPAQPVAKLLVTVPPEPVALETPCGRLELTSRFTTPRLSPRR